MTGLKIALTSAILLVLFMMLYKVAKSPPVNHELVQPFALCAFIAFICIFAGLIYQIWST